MTDQLCISAWLDHPKAGCGRRDFLVAKVGRKHVTLIALGSLATVKLSRTEYDALMKSKATRPIEYKPTRLRRRIKANMDAYGVDTNLCADALKLVSQKRGIAR